MSDDYRPSAFGLYVESADRYADFAMTEAFARERRREIIGAEIVRLIPRRLVELGIRAAAARIVQESEKLGAVAVERIIWEEIDKRLEAKP